MAHPAVAGWVTAYELPRDASADLSMTRREFVAMAHPAVAGWVTRNDDSTPTLQGLIPLWTVLSIPCNL
jgi:hypothetical protein